MTLEKRLSFTHSAIMYQEKFDTWLNLTPLILLTEQLSTLNRWPNEPIFIEKIQLIGVRSLMGLKESGLSPRDLSRAKITPLVPCYLLHECLFNNLSVTYSQEKLIKDFKKVTSEAVKISIESQVSHMLSSMMNIGEKWTNDCLKQVDMKLSRLPNEYINFCIVYEEMLKLINVHKKLSGSTKSDKEFLSYKKVSIKPLNSTVTLTADVIYWKHKYVTFLLNRSYFLEVFNKMTEMKSLILYAWIQDSLSMPDGHYTKCIIFWKHICTKVKYFMNYEKRYDMERENKGFLYLKSIEGLGVSELIRRGDEKWNWVNNKLGQTLWQALFDDNVVNDIHFNNSEFKSMLDTMSEETIAELIGTVKVVGHPSIDVAKGLDDLYKKTHENLPINSATRNNCVGILTRDIIRVFYNKYNRYPKVRLSPMAHPNLHILFNTQRGFNTPEVSKLLEGVSFEDWSNVIFLKNDEFEAMDNRLALLKDKSLGLTRSKVLTNWYTDEVVRRSAVETKAILDFLFSTEEKINLSEYLEKFKKDNWDETLLNYLVVKLTPKEMELKPKGRMFGASPAVERDRRIITEANVMRFMHMLIPDQLLTPNELEILKKLVSFRDYRRLYPNHHVINISFDFSSWNNSMRSEVVDVGAGQILDNWFDTSIYGKTMKAYQNMLVYYDDGIQKRMWDGQLGGIEGLNQATWSIVFIGGIKYALERLGYRYSITVKGDDVRAAIIVPKSIVKIENLSEFQEQIMTSIKKLCRDMGWKLNPNESFVSLSLIATSKQYLFNDTWLPASQKKIMKMESHTNSMFTNLEDVIATVFSIAHSSCSQTTVVLPSFIAASITAADIIGRQLPKNQFNQYSIATMLMWPQILNGPGPLPLQTFFVRGENDMLSVILALYIHIINHPVHYNLIPYIKRILKLELNNPPSGKMILGDPYCLDIKGPDRPESILKRQMKSILTRRVKQPDIKELLSARSEYQSQSLVNILRSMQPYHAKVATALWESSPFYLIEELLSKFTHSSTVMGFFSQMRSMNVMSKVGKRVWRKIVNASEARWSFWLRNLVPYYGNVDIVWGVIWNDFITHCPTRVATSVRNNHWGVVKGLTYPSIVTQNIIIPEKIMDKPHLTYGVVKDGTYSTVTIYKNDYVTQTKSGSMHYAHSKSSRVWLGASTSQKTEYVDIPEATQSPVLRKVKLLLALRKSSRSLGESIVNLVDKLLSSYTNTNIEDLKLLTPINSLEHFAHRVPINSFSMTTMPNSRPNISQLTYIDNEALHKLRKDKENRSINMAARQFFINVLVMFPLQYSLQLSESHPLSYIVVFHNDQEVKREYLFCPYCCANVDDEVITFPDVTHLNLENFRSLPLVSCGDFEREALLTAINNIKYETVKVNQMKRLDDLDVDVRVMHSLRLIISKHIQLSIDTNHMIQREGIHMRRENEHLLDNVLIAEGRKPIDQNVTSLNVWKSVSPSVLYQCIVFETYILFLTRMVGQLPINLHVSSMEPLPALCESALSLLFKKIIEASGLSLISEGSKHMKYIKEELIWGHELDNYSSMSKNFILQHWSLFKYWYIEPEECPVNTSVALFTKDENFVHTLKSKFGYCVNLCLFHLRRGFNMALKYIRDIILDRQELNRLLNTGSVIENQVIVYLRHCLILEFSLENHVFHSDNIEDIGIFEDGTYKLLDYVEEPGLYDITYKFRELRGITQEDIPQYIQNTVIWGIMKNLVLHDGPDAMSNIITVVKILVNIDDYQLEHMVEVCADHVYQFSNRYKPCNEILVMRGSMIECERVVKESFKYIEYEAGNEPLLMRITRHMIMPLNVDLEMAPIITDKCLIKHNIMQRSNPIMKIESINNDALEKSIKENNDKWEISLSLAREKYICDGVDCYRIFGKLNKAFVRWVEILWNIGVTRSQCERDDLIIMIGDGGGSVTRFLLNKFINSYIIFCDKLSNKGPGSSINNLEMPVELIGDRDSSYSNRVSWSGFTSGDISKEETVSNLISRVVSMGKRCGLILSDIVPDVLNMTYGDYSKIILGICKLALSISNHKPIVVLRIPMLPRNEWFRVIRCLVTSFSHIHVLKSNFDQPDLLSLFVVIFITNDTGSYYPNIQRKFEADENLINIDQWVFDSVRLTIDRLIQSKIGNIINNSAINSLYIDRNLSYYLRTIPVAPLDSILKEWSKSITIISHHLCAVISEIKIVTTVRYEMIKSLLQRQILDLNIEMSKLSVISDYTEMIICGSLSIIMDDFMRGSRLTFRSVNEVVNNILSSNKLIISLIKNRGINVKQISDWYFRNVKIKRYVFKSFLRLLSWFSIQYYVRKSRYDTNHVWYSQVIDNNICHLCDLYMSSSISPMTWRSGNQQSILSFVSVGQMGRQWNYHQVEDLFGS